MPPPLAPLVLLPLLAPLSALGAALPSLGAHFPDDRAAPPARPSARLPRPARPVRAPDYPQVSTVYTPINQVEYVQVDVGYWDWDAGGLVTLFNGTDGNAFLGGKVGYSAALRSIIFPCVNGALELNAVCTANLSTSRNNHTDMHFDSTHIINGIMWDWIQNVAYVIHTAKQGDNDQEVFLGTLDPVSGKYTTSAFSFGGYGVVAPALNAVGKEMYFVVSSFANYSDTQLITVSTTTFAKTSVAPTTVGLQDIQYDSDRQTLYGVVNDPSGGCFLASVDAASGAVAKRFVIAADKFIASDAGLNGQTDHVAGFYLTMLTDRVDTYLTLISLDESSVLDETKYNVPFVGGLAFVFSAWTK